MPGNAAVEPGDISLNFVDTDIREIARVILGATLKLNYTIDPSVQGTATLEVGRPLPRSALLPALETLLNQNGATLSVRDGIYRVMPLAPGAVGSVVAAGAEIVGSGTQVIPLRYASAKDLVKVLEPYVAEGGKIGADPGRNALLVSGDPAVRQTLSALIRAFDIDVLAGQSYALFPAGSSTPEKVAAELEKVFRSEGEGALSGVVRVIPMQRVNAVLVVSNQARYIDDARRFLGLERRVEDATARAWHVYYVQNGQSSDLENLLQRAFTPGHVSPTPGPPGATAPGAQPLRMTSTGFGAGGATGAAGSVAQGGARTGGMITAETSESAGAAGPREAANPAAEPLSAPGEAEAGTESRIRIIANRRNNALLVYATPSEYAVIEGMLRKIDIIPLQVLIEATIAEVTLNDTLNYGTQFFLGGKFAGTLTQGSQFTGTTTTGTTTTTTGTTTTTTVPAAGPTAFSVGGVPTTIGNNFPGFVLANGIREVINALANVTQVKVLSAPQLMVLDNEPARLQVGSLVPVLTQSQQSTIAAGAPIVNSIDYRDTGVIMLVTPRVNSGGLVTLDISQEVSDVAQTTTGNIDSPTFDQRLIRTRVAVQDGQTVGMAGLIRDSDTQGNAGIPVLKDVPVLGSLFSSQTGSRQRTELLVLITPHVVKDQRDARALTEDLRNQLVNAGLVRQELQNKPLRGSPNPNRF
ncbi:MAG: type II secretion system secretin GspD [Alphaproteobacteria bacterium]|nr:type II secretion system secretin GspD [Alphaproteobacteria bacterium]